MKEIGEYLKETRIKNGVSIEETAEDLNITAIQLENLEEGNVRAFKDVYVLREIVKIYAKYLGLDSEKIVDEFNDFLFEHTSKISLEDLKELKSVVKKEKEVISPYTVKKKKKIKTIPLLVILLILTVTMLIAYVIMICGNDENTINSELKAICCTMEER
ncbi:MAG: helix-turn-helix domain-containing protein [Bacilli bacterium]|nr:helix-turn-helix domain-containing protein [Bacilli bacterium]